MTETNISTGRRAFRIGGLLIIVGLLLFIWQRQAIYDTYRLFGYTPEPAIAQLATDATMTDTARRMYYVNHPEQQGKATFSEVCPSGTEQSVVLGCYIGGQRGIYLLKIDNEELKGIEQVTAAHEMLHAAYDRLSKGERERVNTLLEDYYQRNLRDDTIKQTIEAYKKSEPTELINEMHSIFGTQIADLPNELEQYYQQYFTNRNQLTTYYQAYEDAFNSRRRQITSYDTQLNSQKRQIDQLNGSVESQSTSLESQRRSLDSSSQTDAAAYNARVDSYNAAVNRYNRDVQRLQSLVDSYNDLVSKRNAIAFEERQLAESLSSPATSR